MDGDGHLAVSRSGQLFLVVAMETADEPLLRQLQQLLAAGAVHPYRNRRASRYVLSSRLGLERLVRCVNGLLQHPGRRQQLQAVCAALGVECLPAAALTADSGWFAGFFDADGCLTFSYGKNRLLKVAVDQKHRSVVEHFRQFFGGSLSYSRRGSGAWCWSIRSRSAVEKFRRYFYRSGLFRSAKSRRFHLVAEFYELRALRAHRPDSPHHRRWRHHLERWGKTAAAGTPELGAGAGAGAPHFPKQRVKSESGFPPKAGFPPEKPFRHRRRR